MTASVEVFPTNVVRLAHAADTGLYHVVIYKDAPMPGPYDPDRTVNRYRSWMHNEKTGHEKIDTAISEALEARVKLGLPRRADDPVPVFEVENATTDGVAGTIIMGRDGTIVG